MGTNERSVYESDIDPNTVCRICLAQSGKLSSVFAKLIVDGYMVSLPVMLAYTLDVSVDHNDDMPQKLCGDCKEQVISFYMFKEKTKRTEKSLHEMLQRSDSSVKQESTQINDDEDALAAYACSMCDKRFKTEDDYYQHIDTDHHDQDQFDIELDEVADIEADADDDGSPEQVDETIAAFEDDGEFMVIQSTSSSTAVVKKRRGQQAASASRQPAVVADKRAAREQRNNEIVLETTNEDSVLVDSFDDEICLQLIDDEDDDGDSDSMSIDQFQCTLCLKSFTDRIKYNAHCRSHDFNSADGDTEFLAPHETIHQSAKSKRNYSEFIRDEMYCMPCNKRLKSSSQVDQHYKMHDAVSMVVHYMDFYPCHECQIIYTADERLTAHLEKQHPGRTAASSGTLRIVEEGDDESYVDYQFLEEDKDGNEYREGQYECGECGIVYPSARDLKNHAVLHQTKFKCPIHGCGCQYDQLSRLSIHIFHKHINSANLQCLHCQEAFETYDKLQAHMKVECKEKKYRCHHCEKKFFSKKALLTHLKTLKEKKYSCTYCIKTFKQQGELTIHLRSHTGERPFQCTICEKSYKTSSMRAAHMDSHITGKTFECDLCQKKLQSRTSYRNHMKRHTEEKKHICMCGKRFFTKYHLRLHQSKMHQDKNTTIKLEFEEVE